MAGPLSRVARRRSRPLGLVSRVLLTVAVLAAAAGPAVLSHTPAQAAPGLPLTEQYNKEVYGNFRISGNAVLVCPANAPVCDSATKRAAGTMTPQSTNDAFAMRYADVDGDADTFNSSTAAVTVPKGATVDFARLYWAGNTGQALDINDNVLKASCLGTNHAPVTLPAGSPTTQPVKIAFGTGEATIVNPTTGYVEDATKLGKNQAAYYSAQADVKDLLAAQPTGQPINVTVGNVWAPTGPGCFGGWSLVYVFKYDDPNPTNAPYKRNIFINAGHVKQGNQDPPTTVKLGGFTALSAAPASVGMTAYEGDWPVSGDQFLINNKNIAEPATGDANNFFISNSPYAVSPNLANNMSVDAKTFKLDPDTIPAGSTSAALTFRTTGDRYLAQTVAFSIPVPDLHITKTADKAVAAAGQDVTFTITVSNPTESDATGVTVTDQATPGCNKTIGALAAGATSTYTCTAKVAANQGTTEFRNTASVTGNQAGTSTTDTDTVDIPIPAISVAISPDPTQATPGDPIKYTVKVTNTGGADLDKVTVTDSVVTGCIKALDAPLKAGDSTTYSCTGTAASDSNNPKTFTNPVNAIGTPVVPDGAKPADPVTASASAVVALSTPAIDVIKTVSPTQVRQGDPLTITETVTNKGDVPLSNVSVVDHDFPDCSKSNLGTLAAGASTKYTCTTKGPADDLTTTSTATGQPPTGQPATADSDPVKVDVIHPSVKITKTAVPQYAAPGDPVAFIITVENTGDVALSDVTVSDPGAPACSHMYGQLDPGASETCGCMITAPNGDFTNTATVKGAPPSGADVSSSDTETVGVAQPAASRGHRA